MGKTLRERLEAKTDMTGGPDSCWPWRGAKSLKRDGAKRGVIHDQGRTISAARAWKAEMHGGSYNRLKEICHRCNNGGNEVDCVNPEHTYWGTHKQNIQDKRHARVPHVSTARRSRRSTRTTRGTSYAPTPESVAQEATDSTSTEAR